MPSPYYGDPPPAGNTGKIADMADAFFRGLQGLFANPATQVNISNIIKAGIVAAEVDPTVIAAHTLSLKNALIDPAVVAAHTLAIKNALIDPAVVAAHTLAIKNALTDPAVLLEWEELIAAGGEDAIVNAVTALVASQTIPTRADWGKAFSLLALACVSERKAYFMKETSSAAYADLKARVTATEVNVLD